MGEPRPSQGATIRWAARLWGPAGNPVSLLLAVVILFSLCRYLHDVSKLLLEAPFIDFAHFYTYATVVAQGENPLEPAAVAPVDARLQIRRAQAPANAPPVFYLLMQPWVLLPFRPAAWIWLAACQICLGVTVWLCLRRFPGAHPAQVGAALFVVLNYQPLMESLALGQSNVFLLALAAAGWMAMRADRPWMVGGAVAVAVHTKAQYAVLLPLLGWMGQRRALARAVLLTGMGAAVGVLVLGPAPNAAYARYILHFPAELLVWTANLSPTAALRRILADVPGGPRVAGPLSLAVTVGLVWLLARALPRAPRPTGQAIDWSWSLGLAAIPLLSPLTEEHHLVVLLLPLTLLLLAPEAPRTRIEAGLLIASVLLLASRYSLERFPPLHRGVASVLLEGKLLGVAALCWILTRRLAAVREARS